MDAALQANHHRMSRQERVIPAAKPTANILSSSSFTNFREDVVVDVVASGEGGPDDVPSGFTEENPPTCQTGLGGMVVELWLNRDAEEFSDHATFAAFPWVAEQLNLHLLPQSRSQKEWLRRAAEEGKLHPQWIPQSGDIFDQPGVTDDRSADPPPNARFSAELDMEGEAGPDGGEEARKEAKDAEELRTNIAALAALITARPKAPPRATASTERALRSRTSPTTAAPADGAGPAAEDEDPGAAEAARAAADSEAEAVASAYAAWETEVRKLEEWIAAERSARARRAGAKSQPPVSADGSRSERRDRAAERTPARGGGTKPCPFTIQRQPTRADKLPVTTAKNVNEQTALSILRRRVTGLLHSLGVRFPELIKKKCPRGVIPAREIPDNLLSDFLTRLIANEQLMKAVIQGFSEARNGEGASFATGILDQTLCGALDRGGVEDRTSLIDNMFGFVATGSLVMVQARHLYVAPAATPGAIKLMALLQSLSLLDRDGNVDFVTTSGKIQTAVAEAGNKPGDNDYHLNTKELMGMCAEAENKVFEFSWMGETHVWATYAQKLTDGAAERANRSYSADDFGDIVRTLVKYGDAQSRRNRGRSGAMEGRARHNSGNVLMLAGDVRAGADGASSEWGSTFDAADHGALENEDIQEVRYIAVSCRNPDCNQLLNPQFPNCMTCGAKQDGTWLCTECNMETRGDGDRCRHAFGGGCPGTRARGRAPTTTESAASLAVSRQVQEEQRARPEWQAKPRPVVKGKGQGGKGAGPGRVLKLGPPGRGSGGGPGGGGGNGGGGSGGGGGNGGSGGAAYNDFRLVLQAEVDRVQSSGGTSTMSPDALKRAMANIQKATQGC